MINPPVEAHPAGELPLVKNKVNLAIENTKIPVSTFNGLVHVEWAPQASVTPMGRVLRFVTFRRHG